MGISRIWKEAFNDEDSYIDFFIKEGLPLGQLLTIGPTDAPFAQLTLFPITFLKNGCAYQGYYLYALGTLQSMRGKGYGKTLLKKAEEFAIETGRNFILLQPTNPTLHKYYNAAGYNAPLYRSCLTFTRLSLNALLEAPLSHATDVVSPKEPYCGLELLSKLSAPIEAHEPSFDCFVWPRSFRQYIGKECFLRGGQVIESAYCYPNNDSNGDYLEIKEFCSPIHQLQSLIQKILFHFPNFNRFLFYGKPLQTDAQLCSPTVFALLYFIDKKHEKQYNPSRSYFALGLD